MTLKDIQELIKLVAKTEISEFKYKDDQLAVHIRGKSFTPYAGMPAPPPTFSMPAPAMNTGIPPAATAATPAASGDAIQEDLPAAAQPVPSRLIEVKSPMIGTFYRSSSPDKPPYVKVGDRISKGDTVCVVEAMKLFNEIETEVTGKIVKVLVEDAQPIEYDQPLFLVDPS